MKDICHIVIMGLINNYKEFGGETGIRTPEPVTQLLPFQGSAIDHSAISPNEAFYNSLSSFFID